MGEERKKVDTYMVYYRCEKCKIGEMRFIGQQKKGIGPKDMLFLHRCSNPKCGNMEGIKNRQYPFPFYVEEGVSVDSVPVGKSPVVSK